MASFSALGGYGPQKIDTKKVEMINQNVKQFIACKTPFETMQQVLKTFKMAFKNVARCENVTKCKNVARCTIFILHIESLLAGLCL